MKIINQKVIKKSESLEKKEYSDIKDKVFEEVKMLFHETSNKKSILKKLNDSDVEFDKKISKMKKINDKIMSMKINLKSTIDSLEFDFNNARKQLISSLEEGVL